MTEFAEDPGATRFSIYLRLVFLGWAIVEPLLLLRIRAHMRCRSFWNFGELIKVAALGVLSAFLVPRFILAPRPTPMPISCIASLF